MSTPSAEQRLNVYPLLRYAYMREEIVQLLKLIFTEDRLAPNETQKGEFAALILFALNDTATMQPDEIIILEILSFAISTDIANWKREFERIRTRNASERSEAYTGAIETFRTRKNSRGTCRSFLNILSRANYLQIFAQKGR